MQCCTTALPTDLRIKSQDIQAVYLHKKPRFLLTIAMMGPLSQRVPEKITEKNENNETFWHTLPKNADRIDRIQKEICHWRPNFIIQNKNKAGQNLAEGIDEILKKFAERVIYEEISFKVAAIFPYLVLFC